MADFKRNRYHFQRDEGENSYYNHFESDRNYPQNRDEYNRINYFPDNDENRRLDNRDYEANQYGVSGTYGFRGNKAELNRERYDYPRESQNRYGRREDREYGNFGYGASNSFGSPYGGLGDYGGSRYLTSWRREHYGRDWNLPGSGHQGSARRDNKNTDDPNIWDQTQGRGSSWFRDENYGRRTEQISGPHRGKGPKGYSRSDDRILEDVCDRLSDDDALDASDIEVQVQQAEVRLDGRVQTKEAKRRAEDIAEDVTGVRNVQNNLRISPIEGTPTTNAVIAAVAKRNNTTFSGQLDVDKK